LKQYSFLLGAGFSKNKGYPLAAEINKKLIDLDAEDFWVHTSGTVILKQKSDNDPCCYTENSKTRYFLINLIKFYICKTVQTFNYEEFYDYYNEIYRNGKIIPDFNSLCDDFRTKFKIEINNTNLLSHANHIFNQLVTLFLVDDDGQNFYDSVHYGKPIFPGYTGFLNYIEQLGSEGTVHIHTLNHDLFFEVFKNSDWINNDFSDGYRELGSPYYGQYSENKVRLRYFSNKYDKTFRLYKLHGSIDQFPFHIQEKGVDAYIKIKFGVGTTNLYKEITNKEGELKYINDWINYHPDFLSGTSSKILRYREPLYYNKVFNHFEKNLSNSASLIIIGYGCTDIEINRIILKNYKNKPVFIVDPNPSDQVKIFSEKCNGKLIMSTPDNITSSDFI